MYISKNIYLFRETPEFIKKLDNILHQYAGRPTPLTPAENLANYLYPKTKSVFYKNNNNLQYFF